ncbi:MAG TPA: hypothetical protein PLO56_07310 [Rhodothermales bacterium]|nr:hypothetical protein [Rhodothermales bacterium]
MRKINVNTTLIVHTISTIFSISHIVVRYDAIVYVFIYFGAAMWGWAWLITEEWPPEARTLNPFMSIALMHAVMNALIFAITPLLRSIA